MEDTFEIVGFDKGPFVSRGIRCFVCGRTSYNPNDIEQRYCGHCHQFHDLMKMMRQFSEELSDGS